MCSASGVFVERKRKKNWKRPEVAFMGTAGLPTMHGPKWLPVDDELNETRSEMEYGCLNSLFALVLKT